MSLILGYETYAEGTANTSQLQVVCTQEAKMCPDGTYVGRTGPNCEFICPGEKKTAPIKNEVKNILQTAKEKKNAFKTEITTIKDEAKSKITEAKNNFKIDLKQIKDANKKIATEKIIEIIQGLNTKTTTNLSTKLDQIYSVLTNIESRVNKAEKSGLDVSLVKTQIENSKLAISDARNTIKNQANKVYTVNITNDASLHPEMKNLRNTFESDMKSLNTAVIKARSAVALTATTLAKIPKVDDVTINN